MPGQLLKSREKKFQVFEGFGAAFTEAAADTFYKMSEGKRAEILNAYFSPRWKQPLLKIRMVESLWLL